MHMHSKNCEHALIRADKIGLKPLSAQAHYLLGNALRTSGNQADAQQNYRDVVQLLDGMRQEAGSDKILQRADFKTMYDEANPASQQRINGQPTCSVFQRLQSSLARTG